MPIFAIWLHRVCRVNPLDVLGKVTDKLLLRWKLADLLLKVYETLQVFLLLLLLLLGLSCFAHFSLLRNHLVKLSAQSRRFEDRVEHLKVFGVLCLLGEQSLVQVLLDPEMMFQWL